MPCLDSMQMNKVHKKKKSLVSLCTVFSNLRDDTHTYPINHTRTHSMADKVGMIMVMIIMMAVITVSSTVVKINLS